MMQRIATVFAAGFVAAVMIGCAPQPAAGDNSAAGTTGPTATTTPSGTKRAVPTSDGPVQSGDTIKIGLVASLTGDLIPWGQDSERGAKLAVEEINKAGGIQGKKVELMVEDSASRPEQGKTAADRLIAKGALGIVGEVASGITAQIADSAFAAGVPVVAVGATRTDLTDRGANIFRVCYTDAFQGPVMARFAYEELRLRRVAVMTDTEQPYSVGLSESFKAKFEALGGTIVKEEFYKSKDQQFNGQLTNIKGQNPDGLFLSGYFNEVGPIARQAREVGLNVRLLGGDGWDSADIVAAGGDAIIGGFFCNHYNNREDRPEVKAFLEKWKAAYGGEPGTTMGALGYDATMLMMDAIKRAGNEINGRTITAALEATEDFPAVSGAITLKGRDGNPPKRALVVEITRQGQIYRKAYDYFE